MCHTIAIWLTLTLAIWRYTVVTRPLRSRDLCSMRRAKWVVLMAYTLSPLLCIPIYCSFSISPISQHPSLPTQMELLHFWNVKNISNLTENWLSNQESQVTRYVVNLSNLARSYPHLKKANFWFFR